MDISDILQDLNSRSIDHDPFADDADIGGIGARDGQRSGQTDLQALTRAWVNERGASELLQYANDPPLSSLSSLTTHNMSLKRWLTHLCF